MRWGLSGRISFAPNRRRGKILRIRVTHCEFPLMSSICPSMTPVKSISGSKSLWRCSTSRRTSLMDASSSLKGKGNSRVSSSCKAKWGTSKSKTVQFLSPRHRLVGAREGNLIRLLVQSWWTSRMQASINHSSKVSFRRTTLLYRKHPRLRYKRKNLK